MPGSRWTKQNGLSGGDREWRTAGRAMPHLGGEDQDSARHQERDTDPPRHPGALRWDSVLGAESREQPPLQARSGPSLVFSLGEASVLGEEESLRVTCGVPSLPRLTPVSLLAQG